MKQSILVLLFLVLGFQLSAQVNKALEIHFKPVFDKSPIRLDEKAYRLDEGNKVRFSELKFYISGIELWNDKAPVFIEGNSFHLVDISVEESLKLKLNIPEKLNFNKVIFLLGIDSLTNTSGALGGDLDPTKGMYWTWQSGYINVKLEGTLAKATGSQTEFQFHLGGYQYPNSALNRVELQYSKTDKIEINFDLQLFFDKVNPEQQNHIMSPGKAAVEYSRLLASCFSIQQP